MTEFSRSLAIVIGINQYHNGIAQLETAVADAVAIAGGKFSLRIKKS